MAAKREDQGKLTAKPGPQEQLASEERALGALRRARDPATREELVRRYLPFAKNLALRYRGASESFDDLLQVASLGLVNAIDRFDPEPRHPLHRLRLADHPRRAEAPLPRPGLDRAGAARPARPHGRSRQSDLRADRGAAALALGRRDRRRGSEVDPTDVLEVLEANHNRRPLSLDRPVGGEEEESPASEWVGDEDEGFELVEDKLALEGALPHLDERERLVLRLRFVEDMTQSQIAERIGHSQMHVSRILRRTLERIRSGVAEDGDEGERG